jgi:hypothetical protein
MLVCYEDIIPKIDLYPTTIYGESKVKQKKLFGKINPRAIGQ